MYQVKLGNKILYYPGSEDAEIYSTDLNEEIGMSGEFKFKVPPNNPVYADLTQGALVTILKDGKEYWRGEIKDIKTDFTKIADVYILEDLAWLGDEYLTPASITNESYAQRFQTAIAAYNANRPADRQFTVGYLTNVTSTDLCNWTTEYDWSILDSLRNCICKDNGYIRVRRVTSGGVTTRYIDIVRLEDYGIQATQAIEYGYNLLDYVKDSDLSNLVNVLTPYGAELDSTVYDGYNARLQGTTITQADSVSTYGRHAKVVIFDEASTLTELNALAQEYLTKYSQPQLTMEVKTVDLEAIQPADAFRLGDSVRIIARPFAVDQRLYLTQIRRDIQNIDKNSITMSGDVEKNKTLTSQMVGTTKAIKSIPSKSSILDAAFKNVLALLDGVDGGIITFHTNEHDQIDELRIANNMDYDQATQCWRWNLGGLAFLERSSPNDEWAPNVAMTMLGEIVADRITTGTMQADRIKGGTLILGGDNNGNGVAIVKNASGTTVVTLDNAGINIQAGQLNIGNNFKVSTNGTVTITGGMFNQIGSGYLHLAQNTNEYCWRFDLGEHYCNCMYYEGGTWHWVNGGATEIYKYLEGAYSPSDQRAKTKIVPLDPEFSKEFINKSAPKMFEFTYKEGIKQFGMIAQDVDETLKDMGFTDKNGLVDVPDDPDAWLSIEYKQYVPHLINCIKDLYAEVNKLKGEENG